MAISHIGTATGTTSATPPTHRAGDLFLVIVTGPSTVTLPSGWTKLPTTATSVFMCWKVAASASEGCTGFTGGTSLILSVYRGVSRVGASEENYQPSGGTWTYPALTMLQPGSMSWVVCAGVTSSGTLPTDAPDGTTFRTNHNGTRDSILSDTNGPVSSWAAANSTDNTSTYRTFSVELMAGGAALFWAFP